MTSSSILIVMRVLPGEGIPAPRLPRPGRRLLGGMDYKWAETVRLTESTQIYIVRIYLLKTKVHS